MKTWYDYGASCNCVTSEVQDELSRPMPATILQQQGIHPHPGPDYGTLTSIYDDECWDYWGWNKADGRTEVFDLAADDHAQDGRCLNGRGANVCDPTAVDQDEQDHCRPDECNDGFSDWYGYPSSHDELCRGRRENVLGTAYIDEAEYFAPPPSMLQAALGSGDACSKEDPSSRKLHRWQIDDQLSEVMSYGGRGLGGYAPPLSVPLSTMVMFNMGKAVTASPGLSRLAVRFV